MIHRPAAIFLLAVFLFPFAATIPQDPPANHRPVNALKRYEPKKYELTFDVTLSTTAATADAAARGGFTFDEAPIVMPVIYQGAYSKVFVDTADGALWIDGEQVPAQMLGKSIIDNKPYNSHLLRMVAPKTTNAQTVRWAVQLITQSWSSDIDERRAQQSTWPRDLNWPAEAKDGLQPQKGIESNAEVFAQIIAANGGDDIRTVSPYIAAKQIVAYCLNNFQISQQAVVRGHVNELKGLTVHGALTVVNNAERNNGRWIGTEADLVAVCVALLRAADIPARPVIGLTEHNREGIEEADTFITWAEFYLPGSGWVPFDPAAMLLRGSGPYRDVTAKWPDFGHIEHLNLRIPLSYFFIPPADGIESPGRNYVAVWGWDPRPQARQDYYDQAINPKITNKGRGEEDPN